ncbi:hypothetical protein QQ045_006244 [Rhodiola kirilowii]
MEEIVWQQRPRVSWLKEGDNNTRYFHSKATARRRTNTIAHLRDSNGYLCEDAESLQHIVMQYFVNIFSSVNQFTYDTMPYFLTDIPPKVSAAQNDILNESYSKREIFAALM